jgi:hypothetical protein
MHLPTAYDDDILNVERGSYPDGTPVKTSIYSIVYPPVGFFPFAGTGNGDYHGFYWPIGREEAEPLVAYSSHDAYALIPEHGDLVAAGRCQLALDPGHELTYEFKSAFAAANFIVPSVEFSDTLAIDDHKQLLGLDPCSPFRNCAVADQYIGENELEAAEGHYRRSIDLLPEYGAAHFGLGYLLRRTRRQSEASIYFRKALICPLAFWGGCFWANHILPGSFRTDWARKALLWINQTKELDASLRDDPFMNRVHELTLDTGVKTSTDVDLLIRMVEEYRQRKQLMDAIYIWISVGDRAALETTSFRERYGMTSRTFGGRLAELLREGGLQTRAELVENMVSASEKPDGLYL